VKHRMLTSLAFWTGLALLTLSFVLTAPPAFLTLRLAMGIPWPRLARWCIWAYGRSVVWLLGLFFPVHVSGVRGQIGDQPRIYVFNHASLLDLFLITLAVPPDGICLARQWPFAVPLFGPVMRLGKYLNVAELSGEALLDRAKALLDQGVSLAIFPEGTRSRTGEMGRFRSGAFKLSIASGVPIRPVSINGTGRILPPRCVGLRSGEINVTVLDDVAVAPDTGKGLRHTAMRRHARERILAACVPVRPTS
jgi:1-acyl-sn-glycerol-3-phosphate acyltransferase